MSHSTSWFSSNWRRINTAALLTRDAHEHAFDDTAAHFGAQTKLVYSGGGDLVCRSLDLTFEAALDDFVTIHQLCLVGAAA